MTGAILNSPPHPRQQMECFVNMCNHDTIRPPAPRTCRKHDAVFPRVNKTIESENRSHVGTSAISTRSNGTFIASLSNRRVRLNVSIITDLSNQLRRLHAHSVSTTIAIHSQRVGHALLTGIAPTDGSRTSCPRGKTPLKSRIVNT